MLLGANMLGLPGQVLTWLCRQALLCMWLPLQGGFENPASLVLAWALTVRVQTGEPKPFSLCTIRLRSDTGPLQRGTGPTEAISQARQGSEML